MFLVIGVYCRGFGLFGLVGVWIYRSVVLLIVDIVICFDGGSF